IIWFTAVGCSKRLLGLGVPNSECIGPLDLDLHFFFLIIQKLKSGSMWQRYNKFETEINFDVVVQVIGHV
ncbi:unnamed protein product, partial [Caenorhabditis brenneri]